MVEQPQQPADRFDEFWNVYPLKKGKDAAKTAWSSALKRGSPQEIIDGAVRYRDDPHRDPDYTKYPQGWLNAGRWNDEPAGPRRSQADSMLDRFLQRTGSLQLTAGDTR